MKSYTVEYREHQPTDPTDKFLCMADDHEHAIEQTRNAYPDCIIAAVDQDGDDAPEMYAGLEAGDSLTILEIQRDGDDVTLILADDCGGVLHFKPAI